MSSLRAEHDLDPLPLERCGLALSWSLAIFGAWAWLLSAGLFTGTMTPASAGYILLAALAIVVQIASNYASAAARRARAFELAGSHAWAVRLMICGGAFNAFNTHHAWEATGLVPALLPFTGEALLANVPVLILSVVLAMFEPALYWIDEALKGEAATRRAAAITATPPTYLPAQVEETPARRQDADVVPMPTPRPRKPRGLVEGAATAIAIAAAVSGAGHGQAHAAQPQAIERTADASARPSAKVQRPSDAAARERAEARAIELLLEGWSVGRPLERETGLHRDTLKRIADRIARAETLAA